MDIEIGQYINLEPPVVPGFPHRLTKTDAVYLANNHQADLDLRWEVYVTLPDTNTHLLQFGDLMAQVIRLIPETAEFYACSVYDGLMKIYLDSDTMTEDHLDLLCSHAN